MFPSYAAERIPSKPNEQESLAPEVLMAGGIPVPTNTTLQYTPQKSVCDIAAPNLDLQGPVLANHMWVVLLFLILATNTLLSIPGIIRKHPLTGGHLDNVQSLILQRVMAFALMVPVLIVQGRNFPEWGLLTTSAAWGILIIAILVPSLSFLLTRADATGSHSRLYAGLQDDTSRWGVYFVATCLYMISYELILRGTILHFLTTKFEVIPAIATNVLIYAAMHLPKNLREALMCIPLGVLLCWMTIYTQSVWPAAFFHTIMALSFEFFYSRKKQHVD